MAYDIEIQSENIVEETSKSVVSVNDPTAEVIANQDNAAEVYSCTYVVVCDDIYIKNYIDNVPAWLQTYLENIANQAVSGTNISLANLISEFQALESGYTATIASVSDSITQQNSTIDTLVTNTNNTLAGISQTLDTKITEAEASALMDQKIATFRDFGLTEASAWWQNIISTVITEQESQALQLSTLSSGMNNNSASVSNLSSAVATLDSAVAKSSQYVTASVNGTTLITGFALTSAIDPEGEKISSMVFNANDFRIYTTTTIPDDTATPIFQAVGSDVWFNGKVTFQGLGIDSDSTSIHGGFLETNTVVADKIDTTDLIVQRVQTPDTQGFAISAYQDVGIEGDKNYNIYGAKMYGGQIKGAFIQGGVIAGSYIQAATSFDQLTEYTACPNYPAGMPVVNNFNNLDNAPDEVLQANTTVVTGQVISQEFNTNILSYYNCVENIYKMKKGTTPFSIYGHSTDYYNATLTNIIEIASCTFTMNQQDQKILNIPSISGANAYSQIVLKIRIKGVLQTIDLTSYLSSLAYTGQYQDHNGWHRRIYKVDIPNIIKPGLGVHILYYDDYGYYDAYLDSFGIWVYFLGAKRMRIFLRPSTVPYTNTEDSGTWAGDILECSVDFKVGTDPSGSYPYKGYTSSVEYAYNQYQNLITVDNTV